MVYTAVAGQCALAEAGRGLRMSRNCHRIVRKAHDHPEESGPGRAQRHPGRRLVLRSEATSQSGKEPRNEIPDETQEGKCHETQRSLTRDSVRRLCLRG